MTTRTTGTICPGGPCPGEHEPECWTMTADVPEPHQRTAEGDHDGLTAGQRIRTDALHEATTIATVVGLLGDDRSAEENAAIVIATARPLVAWITDGDPAPPLLGLG